MLDRKGPGSICLLIWASCSLGRKLHEETIRDAVSERASIHLKDYLTEASKRSQERVHEFVSKKAPRYRPIIARLSKEALNIDPNISDKELDITLHRHLADIEGQMLANGHELMVPRDEESKEKYLERLKEYLKTAHDIKKSDLANYVAHRKVVLDLLALAIQKQPDGKYSREDVIHSLIMPMQKDSKDVLLDNCNLWLIDERLAFHDYLASDKPLASIPTNWLHINERTGYLCSQCF